MIFRTRTQQGKVDKGRPGKLSSVELPSPGWGRIRGSSGGSGRHQPPARSGQELRGCGAPLHHLMRFSTYPADLLPVAAFPSRAAASVPSCDLRDEEVAGQQASDGRLPGSPRRHPLVAAVPPRSLSTSPQTDKRCRSSSCEAETTLGDRQKEDGAQDDQPVEGCRSTGETTV